MAIYTYPENMNNSEFEFRKFTINIVTVKGESSLLGLVKLATDQVVKTADTIATDVGNLMGLSNNLKASTKKNWTTIDTIVLPLPNNLQDSQTHGWNESKGIIGTIGENVMGSTISDVASKLGAPGKVMKAYASRLGVGKISADKSVGALANSLGTRKPIIDPGYFQNYEGSSPRSFSVEWSFVPNSPEEANQILMIIMKLKQYSSPKKTIDGVSLLAPYFFNIQVSNKFVSAMIKLDRVVIKTIDVNYGADGAMQQTADGMPKYIKLNLSLQEVNMTTMDDYSSVPRAESRTESTGV